MASETSMGSRREKSSQRQRRRKKMRRIAFWILIGLIVLVALSGTGFVYANESTKREVNQQYDTVDQQRFLVTRVAPRSIKRIQDRLRLFGWALLPRNRKNAQICLTQYQARMDRTQAISGLMDGKDYYRNNVTATKLNDLDKKLLQEKNQTVYQSQKNRLDTVIVWFDQTNDGEKFINGVYTTFQQHKDQLTQDQVAQADVYFKLLKNKAAIKRWRTPVQEMDADYSKLQKEKSKSEAEADQQALNALKNSPLTQSYTPAKVTISSGSSDNGTGSNNSTTSPEVSSNALTRALNNANITANRLLVLDSSDSTIFIAQRTGSTYNVSGNTYNVLSNGLTSGSYRIRATISDPGDSAGVITDTNSGNFGTYFTTPPTQYANDDNNTVDFNNAQPVFWFKNQPALATSILISSNSQLGFITSGAVSSDNVVRISGSALSDLMSNTSSGLLFYVM